jgi:predicted HAD superfamily Cof-like phosphohydrolase
MDQRFKEPEALNGVARFHRIFHLPVEDKPGIPGKDRCELRIALLEEELDELKSAIEKGSILEAADAFADLQYVLSGSILEFGLGEKFKALFDEVQRSNLSKTCKSRDEAEATQSYYEMHHGTDAVIKKEGKEYLVYRKEDGKVLKSVNYSPPDLENILGE